MCTSPAQYAPTSFLEWQRLCPIDRQLFRVREVSSRTSPFPWKVIFVAGGSSQSSRRHKVSVIVPCYNEERTIEDCLKSVVWADEILVVDSFSTDATLDIARRYTDRILQHEYAYSAAQKNWAIPRASNEWVLIVDSDERVTPGLQEEIQALLQGEPAYDGYWIPRQNVLFGKVVRHAGWGGDTVLRLFRRDKGRYEDKRVHAEVMIRPAGRLSHHLEHLTISTVSEWMVKINRYSTWKAMDKYDKGMTMPLVHLAVRPVARFIKDFFLRKGFLDGWRGFLVAAMSAFAELVMVAKVMELVSKGSSKDL